MLSESTDEDNAYPPGFASIYAFVELSPVAIFVEFVFICVCNALEVVVS